LVAPTLLPQARAKTNIDFGPQLDFSKYKTCPNVDKVRPKVNEEIIEGFESFPPAEKEKEEKRKERAEHPQKPSKNQPFQLE